MARSRINTARRATHRATVLLGDLRAAQTGRLGQRLINRILGRAIGRAMRKAWK